MYPNLRTLRALFRQRLALQYAEREAENALNVVLEDVFGITRHDMLMDPNSSKLPDPSTMEPILRKLEKGVPVQYITGVAPFREFKFKVGPSVLIPRPETEELVQWILDLEQGNSLNIIDIGTGSGCIAWSLFVEGGDWNVLGTDCSVAAIQLAINNAPVGSAKSGNSSISFKEHDILNDEIASLDPPFDVIVSNPPYIPIDELSSLERRVSEHEPHLALFTPGSDDLLFYRRIAEIGPTLLRSGGRLYFEIHEDKAAQVQDLLGSKGYVAIVLKKDLQGKNRMIRAIRP